MMVAMQAMVRYVTMCCATMCCVVPCNAAHLASKGQRLEFIWDEGGLIWSQGMPPLTRLPLALVATAEKFYQVRIACRVWCSCTSDSTTSVVEAAEPRKHARSKWHAIEVSSITTHTSKPGL